MIPLHIPLCDPSPCPLPCPPCPGNNQSALGRYRLVCIFLEFYTNGIIQYAFFFWPGFFHSGHCILSLYTQSLEYSRVSINAGWMNILKNWSWKVGPTWFQPNCTLKTIKDFWNKVLGGGKEYRAYSVKAWYHVIRCWGPVGFYKRQGKCPPCGSKSQKLRLSTHPLLWEIR